MFSSVWVHTTLIQFVSNLSVSCVGTGIMGFMGNKICVALCSLIIFRFAILSKTGKLGCEFKIVKNIPPDQVETLP